MLHGSTLQQTLKFLQGEGDPFCKPELSAECALVPMTARPEATHIPVNYRIVLNFDLKKLIESVLRGF